MGMWVRAKAWVKQKVQSLAWTLISSRVYIKIRRAVSASILPFVGCVAGAAAGAGVAAALAFPIGEGIVLGLVTTSAILVLMCAYRDTAKEKKASRITFIQVSRTKKETYRINQTRT